MKEQKCFCDSCTKPKVCQLSRLTNQYNAVVKQNSELQKEHGIYTDKILTAIEGFLNISEMAESRECQIYCGKLVDQLRGKINANK